MIWVQALTCFALWMVYGILMRSKSENLRGRIHGSDRGVRVFLGSVGLILGLAILFAALWMISSNGGFKDGQLTIWAWPLVAFAGLIFIHLQVIGAAALISLVMDEETARKSRPSNNPEESSK